MPCMELVPEIPGDADGFLQALDIPPACPGTFLLGDIPPATPGTSLLPQVPMEGLQVPATSHHDTQTVPSKSRDAAGLEGEQQQRQLGRREHHSGMYQHPSEDRGPQPPPATAWWASAAGSHPQSTKDGLYHYLISWDRHTPHLPPGNLTFASMFPNQRERSGAGAAGEGGGEPRELGADGLHYEGGDDISAQLQRIRPLFSRPPGVISPLSLFLSCFAVFGGWVAGRSRRLKVIAAAKQTHTHRMMLSGFIGKGRGRGAAPRPTGLGHFAGTGLLQAESTAGMLLWSCRPGGPVPGQFSGAQPASVPVHLPTAPPARRGQDPSTAPTPAAAFAESPGLVGTETAPGWAGLGWGAAMGSWHWFGRRLLGFIIFY